MPPKKVNIPLEVVILLIGGMSVSITGILLFAISARMLPFYQNGAYGLLLVMFAMQIMMLGKTPFGDARRSRGLIACGTVIAAIGIITCFSPVFIRFPRILLMICLGPGGFILLLRMITARDKLRTWARHGGVLWHLVFGCSAVYCLSMLTAVVIWRDTSGAVPLPLVATLVLAYGTAILYLALALQRVYRLYPGAEEGRGTAGPSADLAIILLSGVFMIILGAMLIPVSLQFLPFSGSAQIGLLMVIFAVQMVATGGTPIGPFERSWPIVGFGFLFAALGIVSCIIPGILLGPLTMLVGVLNILGGSIGLVKTLAPRLKRTEGRQTYSPPVLTRLFKTQVIVNVLSVMFGTSMLVPGLVPGPIIGIILAVNGGVLLYMLHILAVLDKLQQAS